ncbi:MAG: glycosyltransferase [Treponema sp.]|nr:glycosyltransferase [Treponema sp.]
MNEKNLVSVVIPTYNRAYCIRRSMDSVLGQTYGNLELIVVDDGSTDGTEDAVRSCTDARVRYIRLEKNGGPSRARNEGIRLARGEFVAFHDSDDVWHPEKLEKQLKLMEEDPECQLVFCKYRVHGKTVSDVPQEDVFDLSGTEHGMLDVLIRENKIGTPTMLLRRSALDAAGTFDEKLRTMEDWDLALRIARQGKISFLPEALLDVYPSEGSVNSILGKSRLEAYIHFLELYWKLYGDKSVFANLLKRIFMEGYTTAGDEQEKKAIRERLRLIDPSVDLLFSLIQEMNDKLQERDDRIQNLDSMNGELAAMLLGKFGGNQGGLSAPPPDEVKHCIDIHKFDRGTLELQGWVFCGGDECFALLETGGHAFTAIPFDRPDVRSAFDLADGTKTGFYFSVPSKSGVYRLFLVDKTRHELSVLHTSPDYVNVTALPAGKPRFIRKAKPLSFFKDGTVPTDEDIKHGSWQEYLPTLCDFKGAEILEVGSRVVTGANFRSRFKNANYTGFDIYPGENVDVVGDAHKLSTYFKDKKFDLIFSSAVFEHLAMPWIASTEIIKLLKPNGYVFIETHYAFSSHERPWHFFQFSENALNVLFPEKFGIKCLKKGCSNLLRDAKFSEEACGYLQGKYVNNLYCHSEFLGQKVQDIPVGSLVWNGVSLEDVVGATRYPTPKF